MCKSELPLHTKYFMLCPCQYISNMEEFIKALVLLSMQVHMHIAPGIAINWNTTMLSHLLRTSKVFFCKTGECYAVWTSLRKLEMSCMPYPEYTLPPMEIDL